MALNQLHSLNYPVLHIVKPAQPFGQLNSRILKRGQYFFGYAALFDGVDHLVRIQGSHTAFIMSDDNYLIRIQLIKRDHDASHNGTEGLGDDGTGVFDNFDITVFEIHRFWQKLNQPRIHTGDDQHFFIREAAGQIAFVFFFLNKLLIKIQNLRYVCHDHASS
ncbi:hypothetical protein D3C75_464660 [compost metagenome]